jgi:DNA replication protein DnaC
MRRIKKVLRLRLALGLSHTVIGAACRMLDDLAVARLEGGANRLLSKLAKVSVLILDDVAMTELTASQRRDLMEVIDDRHERGATVIATQVPVDRWHSLIGNPTYADAILDRLVHQAHRIELKGESLRKLRARDESLSAAASAAE